MENNFNKKRLKQQEKERILKELSLTEIYHEIERRKSLHKKKLRECDSCRKTTDDWVEMDFDMLECRECYETNNKQSEDWYKKNKPKSSSWLIEREKKEKVGCYWWCANDCPQKNESEEKTK